MPENIQNNDADKTLINTNDGMNPVKIKALLFRWLFRVLSILAAFPLIDCAGYPIFVLLFRYGWASDSEFAGYMYAYAYIFLFCWKIIRRNFFSKKDDNFTGHINAVLFTSIFCLSITSVFKVILENFDTLYDNKTFFTISYLALICATGEYIYGRYREKYFVLGLIMAVVGYALRNFIIQFIENLHKIIL
jgi:hypothetical protein